MPIVANEEGYHPRRGSTAGEACGSFNALGDMGSVPVSLANTLLRSTRISIHLYRSAHLGKVQAAGFRIQFRDIFDSCHSLPLTTSQ